MSYVAFQSYSQLESFGIADCFYLRLLDQICNHDQGPVNALVGLCGVKVSKLKVTKSPSKPGQLTCVTGLITRLEINYLTTDI
ncbi:hypothetical protein [Candidatus Coxiella mudrowiae]|uniref:hypothetical protein n=1 Tax=Candidatus Coxiella mudrowiae TaxID=2054173 RepID=UPI000C28C05A|nr:hypothetical protein [Candidatus Coxiella mudrowiae]